MIIKRDLRAQMPSLKRCSSSPAADDRRKRRRDRDDFPIEMLGHVSPSGIPFLPSALRRRLEDLQIQITEEPPAPPSLPPSPPVPRTSRGRALVLPSRFNDSVILPHGKKDRQELKKHKKKRKLGAGLTTVSVAAEDELESYRACRNISVRKYSTSRSTLTESGLMEVAVEGYANAADLEGRVCEKRKDGSEFVPGDIVWAKCGKNYPVWPGMIIDPMQQAPEAVRNSSVAGAVCVMFFGYARNGTRREYAWVKQGMIFPFMDYVDRFQGQTQLYKSKPSDFRLAIEEAFLAEHGVGEMFLAAKTNPRGVQEATDSNHDEECQSQIQTQKKSVSHCESCGLSLSSKTAKKMIHDSEQLVCRHCEKLLRSKQYCAICKRIWRRTDGGSWVKSCLL